MEERIVPVKEAFSSCTADRSVQRLLRLRSDVTAPALPATHLALWIAMAVTDGPRRLREDDPSLPLTPPPGEDLALSGARAAAGDGVGLRWLRPREPGTPCSWPAPFLLRQRDTGGD